AVHCGWIERCPGALCSGSRWLERADWRSRRSGHQAARDRRIQAVVEGRPRRRCLRSTRRRRLQAGCRGKVVHDYNLRHGARV
ncbi:hypothetical protein HK405_000794, partial [Cladochytrium tenue]